MEPIASDKMRQILNQMRASEPISETIQRFEQLYTTIQQDYLKARSVYERFLPEVDEFCPELSQFVRESEPFEKLPAESFLEAENRALDFQDRIQAVMHTFFTRLPSILSYDQLEQCPTLKAYLEQCETQQAV